MGDDKKKKKRKVTKDYVADAQRVIRFGRNKGKVKTRTVSYNRGNKSVNKGYSNVIDKSKL